MTVYDSKNIEFMWRNVTLTGTGDDHAYSISQQGDSIQPYKGVQGEGLNIINNARQWRITRTFKVDSTSLPMLIEDNINYVEDTLVVRDLNTGKSEYAKYLAHRLGLKIVQKKASDIFGKFVGETEENIALSFKEAKNKKAMLIIDEADSFLQSRKNAKNSWEVSFVNEMLTQMENFDYPFVCTTNLMDTLDEASLRRFTFKIKFDFLTSQQIHIAFAHFFKQKISENACNINGLTIGDFVTVKKKLEFLGINNSNDILDLLIQEVKFKNTDSLKNTIGF